MSRLTCWHVEEAADYQIPDMVNGPAYVFIFEYIDVNNEELAIVQLLSEKLLKAVGNVSFGFVVQELRERTGILNLTVADAIAAFGQSKPISEFRGYNE